MARSQSRISEIHGTPDLEPLLIAGARAIRGDVEPVTVVRNCGRKAQLLAGEKAANTANGEHCPLSNCRLKWSMQHKH